MTTIAEKMKNELFVLFFRSLNKASKLHRSRLSQLQREKEEPMVKPLVEEEKFFSGCLHHFGYLANRPKNAPIPEECIICQRLADCMVATVRNDIEQGELSEEWAMLIGKENKMVRCLDCANMLVVIDNKGNLKGYICEAQPKPSSDFRFLEIPRDELSKKKIYCDLFAPLISVRTMTEDEVETHAEQISDFKHQYNKQKSVGDKLHSIFDELFDISKKGFVPEEEY